MDAFVSVPFDNRKHLKQLEPAIYKSDWPSAMVLKIDMHQNHLGKFLEIRKSQAWASPLKTNFLGLG